MSLQSPVALIITCPAENDSDAAFIVFQLGVVECDKSNDSADAINPCEPELMLSSAFRKIIVSTVSVPAFMLV